MIKDILNIDRATLYKFKDKSIMLTPAELAIDSVIKETVKRFNLEDLSRYSATSYYINGFFSKGSIIEAYNAIALDIMSNNPAHQISHNMIYDLCLNIMRGINTIYNEIALESKEYEGSITLSEILDIQLTPTLLEAINRLDEIPSVENVENVFRVLESIMYTPRMRNNNVAIAYLSGTVSSRQVNQCLGVRGFASDLESRIYQIPIATSYALGLRNMKDLAKESRGAATALMNSSGAIRDSETFARETQMICEVVESLERTDCGSTIGISMIVEKGMLSALTGQMYKKKDEDQWSIITENDKDLEDTPIIIRTALSCKLKNRKHVCIACFGKFGLHVPYGFNIGHWSCSKMNEPAAQSILSTKHYITSSDGGEVRIKREDAKYIAIDKDNKIRLIVKPSEYASIHIRLKKEDLERLKDLRASDSLFKEAVLDASKVREFTLELEKKDGKRIFHTIYMNDNKTGRCTESFIRHILSRDYEVTKNEYIIPMKGYKMNKPIIIVPDSIFDFKAYNKKLSTIIRSRKAPDNTTIHTADKLLKTLTKFINEKLYCHIAPLAVIVYAVTARNPKENDYSLCREIDAPISTISNILTGRNLSLTLAYGKADKLFVSQSSLNNDSEAHILSLLFAPQDAIKEIKGK